MANDTIIAQIDAEIARLKQARELLARSGQVANKVTSSKVKMVAGKVRKKHVLSAEARKRIADAQRRRWAAHKAKAKSK